MEPINERFAPAEGYSTHEALKAIFRHYADLGRKPRAGVERGVDRTQWAKLVSESPDLPARLARPTPTSCLRRSRPVWKSTGATGAPTILN